MGALAPGPAHAKPSAQATINTSGNCLGTPKFVLPYILFCVWLKTQCKIVEP